jgi:membrane protein YqaA with SNARE-associated domain
VHLNGVIEAPGWWSYVLVFVLTASETSAFVGLLVPGETAVLLGAAVAGRGGLNVFLLAAVVVAGAVTGDSLGYALGRRCARRPGRQRPPAARHTARARAFLAHHGAATVLTSKFIGFARTFGALCRRLLRHALPPLPGLQRPGLTGLGRRDGDPRLFRRSGRRRLPAPARPDRCPGGSPPSPHSSSSS